MFVDEYARFSATAEGFETEGAGTTEEVEHPGIEDIFAKDGEDRLADEVGCGPGDRRGDLDGDAAGFSCDDSHRGKVPGFVVGHQEEPGGRGFQNRQGV